MKKRELTLIFLLLFGMSIFPSHAQMVSTSDYLTAQPIQDRTVMFNVSETGVSKPILWGLDTAWPSEDNMRRGVAFMGADRVDIVRVSFQPTHPLINGNLHEEQINWINERLRLVDFTGPDTKVVLNSDHPSVDPWYSGNAANWAQLMDVTTARYQEGGRTVVSIAPFNEPDYGWGQGSMNDFYNIAGELRNNPRFNNIRICGGNTLNVDQALPWYNYLKDRLDEGNTHQLAGSFDSYANFFQTVRSNGHHATNDELHNVMEAMVGVEYGMQTGIWWGTAELARGEFVKAGDGKRLAYAEHRPNWTAASVYRSPEGKVQAFGGTSERQATTTTFRFVSKDRDVYYDGHGPQRDYTLVMPGGTGYMQGQTNAERVVNITWGDDIQPVINGRYLLVNRNSSKVMEVAGGAMEPGAEVRQNDYTGGEYQQWNVTPVDPRIGGDFSYFSIVAAHSGKSLDILNWSLEDGTGIIAWDDTKGGNQQWYLEYAEEGWFYIRSRHSAKCLEAADNGQGVLIQQRSKNGNDNQQWRFLAVDAPIEFVSPGVPANLTANPNTESVRLDWTGSPDSDLAGYVVFRSETAGGPYNTIARNVATTSFVDNTVSAGVQYYYVVKAMDRSLNRSDYSNEVSATATGDRDMVARYPFDENTQDNTLHLNHSALYGTASFVPGEVGAGSIALNGRDHFLQLPATLIHHPSITLTSWIYWNGGGMWQRIFDFGNGENENMFLTPYSDSGRLRFAIKNAGPEERLDGPEMPQGRWVHIAVTLDGSQARMYMNGELVAQSDAFTIKPTDFNPVLNYIGRSQYPDPLLNGNMDDFRVYNYALSAGEIASVVRPLMPGIIAGNTYVCPGESMLLTGEPGTGGSGSYSYQWQLSEDNINWTDLSGETQLELTYPGVTAMTYFRRLVSDDYETQISNVMAVDIVPPVAYWSKTPEDHNWNNPNNWTDESGNPLHSVPFACTNVHIPGNSSIYPDLSESHTPRHLYGDPVCNEITFRFGSEVAKQNYLTYGKAYVQYNFGYYQGNTNIYRTDGDPHSAEPMKRNRWYALSAPLNKIVSGDFSVGGYPNFWQQGFKTSRGYSGELIGDWYSPSNTNVMSPGDHGHYGISVWAARMQPFIGENNHSNLNALKGILEMPYFENSAVSELHRIHDYEEGWSSFKYYYYDLPGLDLVPESVRAYDRISRGEEAYRFVTDDRDKWTSVAGVPAFKMEVPSGAEIMIGNPFLSSLDFGLFYEANRDRLEEYFRLYEVPWNTYVPGLSPSSGLIPSFQAFFVKTTGTPGETTELYFPESASVSRSGDFVLKTSVSEGAVLYAEAYGPDETVGKALIVSEGKSVKNIPQLFVDSENDPEAARAPQLYFLGEEGSKNVLLNAGESTFEKTIKLGLASTCTGDITLKFDNVRTFAPSGLYLKDTYAGNTIDLTTANTYTFRHDPSVCDRFELSFGESGMLSGLGDNARESSVVIRTEGRLLYVSSGEPLSSIRVYTVQGTAVLTDENPETQWVRRLNVPEGVYLVKITYPNHKVKTEKVVVN